MGCEKFCEGLEIFYMGVILGVFRVDVLEL